MDALLDDWLELKSDELMVSSDPADVDAELPAALPGGKTGPICCGVIPLRSVALLATAPTARGCFFFTKSGPDALTIIDDLSMSFDASRGS